MCKVRSDLSTDEIITNLNDLWRNDILTVVQTMQLSTLYVMEWAIEQREEA
jgi:hypothetical protein